MFGLQLGIVSKSTTKLGWEKNRVFTRKLNLFQPTEKSSAFYNPFLFVINTLK